MRLKLEELIVGSVGNIWFVMELLKKTLVFTFLSNRQAAFDDSHDGL